MPIINYEQAAKSAYEAVLNSPEVSDQNKEYVKLFDAAYKLRVKPATRSKFYRHVIFFLKTNPDIKTLFDNPAEVNDLFARLRRDLSPGYYGTMVNCVNAFVRWLNDDIKPRGFKDIKSPKKGEQRRMLDKRDMWEWEDAELVAKQTPSTMFQALIMTELNLGARPSELIDLRYGDIELKGKFIIIHIRGGKTGSREAVLYYAVPYLTRWLNEHPTKRRNDPLWITENVKNSHAKQKDGSFSNGLRVGTIKPLTYNTLRKRVEYLVKKAGLDKPYDVYTLRHSCARLLRLWGVPIEECAKQLGHSVKEFEQTYGRLDTSDREARHAQAYGISTELDVTPPPTPTDCKRCGMSNTPHTDFCARCGTPLSVAKALEAEQEAKERADQLDERMEALYNMILRDPRYREKLTKAGGRVLD